MNSNYRYEWCLKRFLLKQYTDREFKHFPLAVFRFILFHDHAIPISYTPFYCAYPGKYILTQDLYFDHSFGAAITIMSSNTHINLNGFGIYLTSIHGRKFPGINYNKYCVRVNPNIKSISVSDGSFNGHDSCETHIGVDIIDIDDDENVKLNNILCKDLSTWFKW